MRGAGLGIALIAGGPAARRHGRRCRSSLGAAVLGVTHPCPATGAPTATRHAPDDSGRDGWHHARELLPAQPLDADVRDRERDVGVQLRRAEDFIVLYITKGLGHSKHLASAFIAIVAVAYVVGAPIAGRLAERFGIVARHGGVRGGVRRHPVLRRARDKHHADAGGAADSARSPASILMTLPQALAFTLAPDTGQGAAAGLVDFSRGVGVVLGPVLVGAAVSASSSALSDDPGYAIMWPMIGAPILLSLAFSAAAPQPLRTSISLSSSPASLPCGRLARRRRRPRSARPPRGSAQHRRGTPAATTARRPTPAPGRRAAPSRTAASAVVQQRGRVGNGDVGRRQIDRQAPP